MLVARRFEDEACDRLVDAFFGLKEELEALFGRPVDLLTEPPVRNPHLRESIERSRRTLYAA